MEYHETKSVGKQYHDRQLPQPHSNRPQKTEKWNRLYPLPKGSGNNTLHARAVLHHTHKRLPEFLLPFHYFFLSLIFSDNENLILDAAKNHVAMNFYNKYVYLYLHVLI